MPDNVKKKRRNVLAGIIAGMLAGAAATAAMDGYWAIVRNEPGERPEQKPKRGDDNQEKEEPSTQIIADKVSKAVTGREVPKKHKAEAGVAVHYATGLLWGAAFGALAARIPRLGIVAGLIYGVFIWLALDEIGLRALNIAPDADEVPLEEHVQALGAHLIFGGATGLATRLLLRR
ncbi:MAG TPA: DUF1440 domain-containing protein [Chloroflexia bacterium]|jgi:uncharacterized membrane protein YagU involved in acid resistance